MTKKEIDDKAHSMNLRDFKTASLMIYSQNRDELFEIVQTYINTLSYNAAWDFETFDDMVGTEYRTTLTFKYNGSIRACSALGKLKFGYAYRKEAKW